MQEVKTEKHHSKIAHLILLLRALLVFIFPDLDLLHSTMKSFTFKWVHTRLVFSYLASLTICHKHYFYGIMGNAPANLYSVLVRPHTNMYN